MGVASTCLFAEVIFAWMLVYVGCKVCPLSGGYWLLEVTTSMLTESLFMQIKLITAHISLHCFYSHQNTASSQCHHWLEETTLSGTMVES